MFYTDVHRERDFNWWKEETATNEHFFKADSASFASCKSQKQKTKRQKQNEIVKNTTNIWLLVRKHWNVTIFKNIFQQHWSSCVIINCVKSWFFCFSFSNKFVTIYLIWLLCLK